MVDSRRCSFSRSNTAALEHINTIIPAHLLSLIALRSVGSDRATDDGCSRRSSHRQTAAIMVVEADSADQRRSVGGEMGWEVRPGGMLVQKRSADPEESEAAAMRAVVNSIRVRVLYGASRYNVAIRSFATFGELKKLLSVETGLKTTEQKLLFNSKERGNSEYLDRCGVKDKSKVILLEDPASLERKYINMQKNARIQSTHRAIYAIALEVEKLAEQVVAIEKSISNATKAPDVQITTLIELLMTQAVKLDKVPVEGDASSQIRVQANRVQKCVETLDMLKIQNATIKPDVVATKWERFRTPATTHSATNWEFFD